MKGRQRKQEDEEEGWKLDEEGGLRREQEVGERDRASPRGIIR